MKYYPVVKSRTRLLTPTPWAPERSPAELVFALVLRNTAEQND